MNIGEIVPNVRHSLDSGELKLVGLIPMHIDVFYEEYKCQTCGDYFREDDYEDLEIYMQGKRINNDEQNVTDSGDYWLYNDIWYGFTPNGLLASLKNHQVTEHEDGTITASPSIMVTTWNKSWHGYLENGIWREAS